MAAFRVVQITDLHIGARGERPRDVDVRSNLELVLQAIAGESADHLVISGDLSYRDGDRDAYQHVRSLVENLDLPYSVIGGNHDISVNLAEEFGRTTDLSGDELYYAVKLPEGDGQMVFLDTVRGTVSDRQLAWLRRTLEGAQSPIVLFMHHPPMLCNCTFMDTNYPFERSADILPVLSGARALAAVFCGHYHAEAEEPLPDRAEVRVHVTPSLWFQIDRSAEDMIISDRRVGYRVIDVEGGAVRSRVEYLPPSK
ncbi:MAG TPA: metallophosphoesterase [Spirochaetia bacterium]|nr:metallophosphoesterase [Spirochaetia bacterium]